jgi:peptidoglycan/LPS O-acetylase OafA/YrhL
MTSGFLTPSMTGAISSAATGRPGPKVAGHIPALDGVRGLAILAVMFYRFGLQGDFYQSVDPSDQLPHWASLGLALGQRGVDLFFVLSGFLITGILFDAKGESQFFRHFYTRRVLRILPLYYASLVMFLLVIPCFLSPTQFPTKHAMEDQHWLWLHAANLSFLFRGDWSLGRLDHFWSLAIEEHFYFVWPLVIFLCTRRAAQWVCVWGFILTPLARIAWIKSGGVDVALDTLTIFRLEGLLAGAWLALASRGPGGAGALAKWAWWTFGVSAILLAPTLLTDKRLLTIPETLFALFFASLLALILCGNARSRLVSLCELPVLRFFGKYSYAMYIFQNPLVPLTALIISSDQLEALTGSFVGGRILYGVLMMVLTTLVALASWHLFEKHFLALKDVLAPKHRSA